MVFLKILALTSEAYLEHSRTSKMELLVNRYLGLHVINIHTHNHGQNILRLFDVLPNFLSPRVKRRVIISYKDALYELPRELPNDLTFTISEK